MSRGLPRFRRQRVRHGPEGSGRLREVRCRFRDAPDHIAGAAKSLEHVRQVDRGYADTLICDLETCLRSGISLFDVDRHDDVTALGAVLDGV